MGSCWRRLLIPGYWHHSSPLRTSHQRRPFSSGQSNRAEMRQISRYSASASRRVVSRRKGDSSSRLRWAVLSCDSGWPMAFSQRGPYLAQQRRSRRQWRQVAVAHQALLNERIHVCIAGPVRYAAAQRPSLAQASAAAGKATQRGQHGHHMAQTTGN